MVSNFWWGNWKFSFKEVKLYHCARDVLPLLGAFFNFYFFQKGFGSQLSCQGTPEISQGPLKAGGQRPLTFPFAMNDGEGLISSSGRLIQANNHPHLIIIIKKKTPLSISTHVQLIIQTLQWFTSPSRLAKMHGARDIYRKKTTFILKHLFGYYSLFINFNNDRQTEDYNRKSVQVQTCRGCGRYRPYWAPQLHAIVTMLLVLYGIWLDQQHGIFL